MTLHSCNTVAATRVYSCKTRKQPRKPGSRKHRPSLGPSLIPIKKTGWPNTTHNHGPRQPATATVFALTRARAQGEACRMPCKSEDSHHKAYSTAKEPPGRLGAGPPQLSCCHAPMQMCRATSTPTQTCHHNHDQSSHKQLPAGKLCPSHLQLKGLYDVAESMCTAQGGPDCLPNANGLSNQTTQQPVQRHDV